MDTCQQDSVLPHASFVGLTWQRGGDAELHVLLRDSMVRDTLGWGVVAVGKDRG